MAFKIGDKVRVLPGRDWNGRFSVGDEFIITEDENDGWTQINDNFTRSSGDPAPCLADRFELVNAAVDAIAEAIKILEGAGYTGITPPKSRCGRVVVMAYSPGDTETFCITEEKYLSNKVYYEKQAYEYLATLDWKEE